MVRLKATTVWGVVLFYGVDGGVKNSVWVHEFNTMHGAREDARESITDS